jgi:DNA polymerase III subunit epsilon
VNKIFFDTETTGLTPGRIIQLAYLIVKPNIKKITAKNFFFYVDEEISESAISVHGITKEKLKELSKGKRFFDYYDEIREDFNNNIWIAHNIDFDYKFLVYEINEVRMVSGKIKLTKKNILPAQMVCTVQYFTPIIKLPQTKYGGRYKYPKLQELTEYFSVTEQIIKNITARAFGIDSNGINMHDARYDVMGMYICTQKYKTIRHKIKENAV